MDVSQLLGEYSNGWLGTAGIGHIFMPQWRVSPFVAIGGGVVYVEPKATLVRGRATGPTGPPTRARACVATSPTASCCRREYRQFLVFTDTNDNEVINEWTVGFTHFF